VFACATDWPGLCRRAKTDDDALASLAEYLPRYAKVAQRAGFAVPLDATFAIVERLVAVPSAKGYTAVDFGATEAPCAADARPLTAKDAKRLAALVAAAWAELDDVVGAAPAQLRKGPRGGGRDRDAVVEHVLGAESAYARKIGLPIRQPDRDDAAGIDTMRLAILDVLRTARAGVPLCERGWLPRQAARRIAWHVLDHAWEIEDRSQ